MRHSPADDLKFRAVLAEVRAAEKLLPPAVVELLHRMELDGVPAAARTRRGLVERLGICPEQVAQWEMMLGVAAEAGFVGWDGERLELRESFHDRPAIALAMDALRRRAADATHGIGPKFALLLEVMEAYPRILRGEIKPHTILFPGGSMEKALKMYEGDPVSDAQNRTLAEVVVASVEEWSREIPDRPVQLLEVGAGTGASSRVVLAALAQAAKPVRYVYTDVSPGFFLPVRAELSARYPFVEFRPYDVERAPGEQGLEPHSMDLVFGTNCFHATGSIRHTLAQAKRLLRRNGLLVLTEFVEGGLMGSLAWGAVPGWWSATDREYRVKDAPFLPLESWLQNLSLTGFRGTRALTIPAEPPWSAAVLVSESDGWIEAERTDPVPARRPPEPGQTPAKTRDWLPPGTAELPGRAPPARQPAPLPPLPPVPHVPAGQGMVSRLSGIFAEVLRVPVGDLRDELTFDHYGVDSLVAMSLGQRLEKDFGKLPATLLFEFNTLRSLAEYLEAAAARPAATAAVPAQVPVPAPAQVVAARPAPAAPPATDARDAVAGWLAGVFAEVLRLPREQLGPDKGFDQFGIDSLVSLTINRALEEHLGKLPATLLFEATTLRALAESLLGSHGPRLREVVPALGAVPGAAPQPGTPAGPAVAPEADASFPLTPVQRQIWFLQRLDPGGSAYHVVRGARIPTRIEPAGFRRAMEAVLARNALLRCSFEERDGIPVGRVHPRVEPRILEVDLTHLPAAEALVQAAARARAEARLPYAMEEPGLLRVLLARLPGDETAGFFLAHHLVADAMALAIIMREAFVAYQAVRAGGDPRLPPRTRDFPDHARELAAKPEDAESRRGIEYFRQAMAGSDPDLPIPPDFPAGGTPGDAGGQVFAAIEPEAGRAVAAFAKDHGATASIFYGAVLATLIHRYSGREDFNLGTVAFNRPGPDQDVVGPYASTLPLRVRIDGTLGFRQVLHAMRATMLEALFHPGVALEDVVSALGGRRRAHLSPLFQVLVNYLNRPEVTEFTAGRNEIRVDLGAAQFDLSVDLYDWNGNVQLVLEYRTGTFRRETIERLARHFRALVDAVRADPDRPIAKLAYLGAGEEAGLRELGASAPRAAPPAALDPLTDEILARAEAHPERIALVHLGKDLDFAGLRRRVLQLAAALAAAGIGPGDRVALVADASPDQVAAMLAVWRRGAVLVPVDPRGGGERTRLILEDAGVTRILVTSPPADRDSRTLVLPAASRDGDPDPGPARIDPEGLAYLVYTSGTQGRPKGVMVRHRNLAAHVRAMRDVYRMEPGDRFLQLASPAFDLFFEEVLVPLAAGHGVVLGRDHVPLDAAGLYAAVADLGITHLSLSASHWQTLVETGPGLPLPACVKLLVVGNERVLAHGYRKWRRANPGIRFLNAYGPTETTVTSLVHEAEGDRVGGASVPIGRPLPGQEVLLVDRNLRLVPAGIPGEILIGGSGVGAGYWNLPAQTAARFLPDPVSPGSGKTFYRTGDLARWLPGGALEFLGRDDNQVKLRGYRIELEEIEGRLAEHPDVVEAAVVPAGEGAAAELVAFVRWRGDPGLPRESLTAFLAARLPAPMIPAAYYRVPELPRLVSGKIDRGGLLARRDEAARFLDARRAPRRAGSATEERLARMFGDLLGSAAPAGEADFFEAGGTSLQALRLLHRIRQELGVEISVPTLYSGASIPALAARIDRKDPAEASRPDPVSHLRAGDSDSGLVLLPGAGTDLLGMAALAARLGTGRTVYAFDWNAQLGDPAIGSVEQLAALGADALVARSKLRTFTVLGWSMGGVLGYELVAALEARGVAVDQLILLDSYWPEDLAGFGLPEPFAEGLPPEAAEAIRRSLARADSLFSAYRNGLRRAVGATLFTARDFPGDPQLREDALRRWDQCFDRPPVRRVVEGDHFTMLRTPLLDSLASQIEALLRTRAA